MPTHVPAPDLAPILRIHDLTVGYGNRAAVHHVSCCFEPCSLTALVGQNGSGKSTLIKAIAGLLRPLGGKCQVARGTSVAYLPQQSELDRSFPARTRDVVALGLWPRRGLLGRHRAEDRILVTEALAAVGLAGFEDRPTDSLSGGQMQRALFARVLVQNADLILLDEPFNAVDEATVRDLMALIHGWQAQGRTVLTVMHDLDLVRAEFPQTLLLAREGIACGPTPEVLTTENLRRARAFREASHHASPICDAA